VRGLIYTVVGDAVVFAILISKTCSSHVRQSAAAKADSHSGESGIM